MEDYSLKSKPPHAEPGDVAGLTRGLNMNRRSILAAALVAAFGFVAVENAAYAAEVKKFKGTRDQVRTACKEQGGEIMEGPDHTWCGTDKGGVVCDDTNTCWGNTVESRGVVVRPNLVPPNARKLLAQ